MKPLLLLFLLLPSLAFAQQATIPPVPPVAAKSYLLMDFYTRQTLVGSNMDERIEPASLTKLMTAYLTFAALKQKQLTLDQALPVSPRAWKVHGSRMFIEPGKPVAVAELMRGMIVQSGNDACVALAEGIAGSEEVFAQMMNREAARLGMKNTHFVNSTGLPHPQHYTTASDLGLLAAAVIRDFPEYFPLYSMREYRYNNITQPNRNRLLWLDPNVDGMKTGYTENAGYCLIATARRGPQRRLISIVLGTRSEAARASESQKLLNYGFQFYDTVRLYEKGQSIVALPVWKGSENLLKAGFNQDLLLSLPKGQAPRLKADLETQQPILAPVSAGQQVGTVKVSLDGRPIGQFPVVALENIGIATIFGRGWDSIRLLFK